MSQTPLAFMSYVNLDDHHEQGWLANFPKSLISEVKTLRKQPFEILQDHEDTTWEKQWKKRIKDSLNAVTFLIPIITPPFFKEDTCRKDLECFLKWEKELGRDDLILPVYYIKCPILSDKAKLEDDPLVKAIAKRPYTDWVELRFKSFDSEQVCETIAKMAQQIVAALDRSQAEPPKPKPVQPPSSTGCNPITVCAFIGAALFAAIYYSHETTNSKTLLVDQLDRGDYATITDAIDAAEPGTRILVRPGIYKEGIVIDKPVEIIGDGKRDDIVIEAYGKDVVLFQAGNGRLANLTLRQVDGGEWYGVVITQGRLDIEDCDILSQGGACRAIHRTVDLTLRRNRINNGKSACILVYENGQGALEDNEIDDRDRRQSDPAP